MLTPLRNPAYRKLFAAQIIALIGTGLATVALGLLAYELDPKNAAGVLGTALTVKMVAYVFVAPLASAAVAKLSRRSVLIGADLLRLAVAASLPFVTETWQIYPLIFILQAASATFTPTFQSVIPEILHEEEEYTNALSLSRLAYDLEAALSPMLAAALLLVMHSNDLFFGTALGFLGSALLVASAAFPTKGSIGDDESEIPFGKRARGGIELFFHNPHLRPILFLNLAVAAAGAFVLVQTVVIAKTNFGGDDGTVALLLAVNGAGSMLGAFTLPRLLKHIPEKTVMLAGALLLTFATMLIPLALGISSRTPGLIAIGALWLATGLGWASAETPVGRIIRRHTSPGQFGQAFAAQFSLSHACWLVTYPLAGWLGTWSLTGAAIVLAAIAAVSAAGAFSTWTRTTASPMMTSQSS
ncbi:MFS transporter [Timonella senegalensis]|uniref:MFS transporter n=1 Tax=Timonella senegalensis TaxID=1465825 RepID=UPI0003074ED4|nr:MFS transporter [Timonella senegalensis]